MFLIEKYRRAMQKTTTVIIFDMNFNSHETSGAFL